ncbi:uncharacterized protein LOC132738788 [Ruditapes philippinarum]|uniref:uncharacterized protein LOC132738788 n=1 Tax=Ruditapes philippinarum TaxID=129788 RepID=UPI00295B5383|nr:uncharacterized protein LOC132738788 [Ruditapes philippinarum]
MDAKYEQSEMEPLGKNDLNVMELQRNPHYTKDCSCESKNTSKWWFLKPCLKCIILVVVVFTVLLLAQSINKLGNKLEGKKEQTEIKQHSSLPQALKGSRLGLSLLDRKLPINRNLFDDDEADSPHNRDGKQGQGETEKEAYRKHYFDIGMREDSMMQDCQNPHMKHSFPDIDYALLGYDIFKGFPLADGHDPGFTYPIFAPDYSHGHMTADCRYSVPKGYLVIPDVSCVTSFTSDVIQDSEELFRSLSANAGVTGGGFGVAFSASAGYKQVSADLASSESLYIISTAHCNYYISKFKKENPPPFSQMFYDWIYKLNSSTDNDVVFDFFDTFGTHFAKEVSFGARYSYQHKMKSSMFKSKSENGINVAAQASYSGLFSVSGGFSLTSEQRREASDFSKSVETKTITVGAAPPANGDAMTWASTVQNNPVPSQYKLEPIENLFHERYMGNLVINYQTIASKLESLKMKYYNTLIAKRYQTEVENQSNRWITKTLMLDSVRRYGTWQPPQFCPAGTFAKGYSLKIKQLQTSKLSTITVEGIRLLCVDKLGKQSENQTPHHIPHVQSGEGGSGQWTGQKFCPQGGGETTVFLNKFALKIQESENMKNRSVNGIHFSCRDLQWTKHSFTDSPFDKDITSSWSEECPLESVICGIQTHIEKDMLNIGASNLNDIRFYCCGDDSAYLNGDVTF